ncbi:MAG: histidine triad nucleotide-binding protein [Waddliaceae bacterium]|jgi:histidine triad (HIT) family protein|nr:histidine triad nucleotide-binding protein [Waddliaceae bacterium]MBT3579568.1 histidine triad nucleotide-binding protein [Waddliaceae bacterium]MBT4444430.1 histidine triad nucleotide-binding protein [Waddliaceae bacterium]MBT6928175.1 histidine triad nucleotide-binding protein [Waddliaceae bacterium]MBT7263951.1 histidine triad nucleotide-binding protein [Waddliaceae bacterium]
MTTIFSKILDGEIPCDKVFENERILAFNDINPVAPVHILIIPKRRGIESLKGLNDGDTALVGEMVMVAKSLAEEYGVAEGYRLLTNVGNHAGQAVYHLHFHLIGGRPLGPMA